MTPASNAADAGKVKRLARKAASSLTATGPRTGQKVHRNSRHRGDRERSWWRPVDPLEARAIVEAAKMHDLATKEPGKRNGALGATAIKILELMADLVSWSDGTLEPSYTYIKARTKLSIDAIWKALKRLDTEGFLKWIRRTQPVEDDGSGRYVEQIENAYRLEVPASWAGRVRMRVLQWRERAKRAGERWRDDRDEEADRAARKAAERRRNSIRFVEETVSDPELRAAIIADIEGKAAIPPG